MAKRPLIEAQKRDVSGTRAVKRLRKTGVVPGVIYGQGAPTESLVVQEARLREVIETRSRMVEVRLNSQTFPAVLKQVQYDHLGSDIYHVDFERINLTEIVRVEVPIETHGTARGTRNGGVLDVILKRVMIECKASDIPNEILVEVGDLEMGQTVTVGQLSLPADVKVIGDPTTIAVAVLAPRSEEELAAPLEGEMAEPEVIGAKKEEEEEEEK